MISFNTWWDSLPERVQDDYMDMSTLEAMATTWSACQELADKNNDLAAEWCHRSLSND